MAGSNNRGAENKVGGLFGECLSHDVWVWKERGAPGHPQQLPVPYPTDIPAASQSGVGASGDTSTPHMALPQHPSHSERQVGNKPPRPRCLSSSGAVWWLTAHQPPAHPPAVGRLGGTCHLWWLPRAAQIPTEVPRQNHGRLKAKLECFPKHYLSHPPCGHLLLCFSISPLWFKASLWERTIPSPQQVSLGPHPCCRQQHWGDAGAPPLPLQRDISLQKGKTTPF